MPRSSGSPAPDPGRTLRGVTVVTDAAGHDTEGLRPAAGRFWHTIDTAACCAVPARLRRTLTIAVVVGTGHAR